MKRILFGLLLITVVSRLLITQAATLWQRVGRNGRSASTPPLLLHDFREGDIIFRQGDSLASDFILSLDENQIFSHTGIITYIDRQPHVIHTLPADEKHSGTVEIEPLAVFLDEAVVASLYRLVTQTGKEGDKAAAYATELATQKIPFDTSFDLHNDTLYCSELVWQVYQQAGIDLINGEFDQLSFPLAEGAYILPTSLAKSKHLQFVTVLK